VTGDISGVTGDISGENGDISGVTGDISGETGDISGLMAKINESVLFVTNHGLTVRIELSFTSEACWARLDELIEHRNVINCVKAQRLSCLSAFPFASSS
jgi:hypothetical protein